MSSSTSAGAASYPGAKLELDRILRDGLLRTTFQPILDLESMSTVAYDTLTHGPPDSPLESPESLLKAAIDGGLLLEFRAAARHSAIAHAEQAGLRSPGCLFFDAEPVTIQALAHNDAALSRPMVLEISGRSLAAAELVPLLRAIIGIRDQGWAIAVTEIGLDPLALALLPIIAPDVITLDLQLLQDLPDQNLASVVSAVSAYSEATGCLVLATGVETERQTVTARAFGATLAQGPLYGEAGALPATIPWLSGVRSAPTGRLAGLRRDTPYSLAAERREARVSRRELLLEISLFLEARAALEHRSAVVLGTFQHRANFNERALQRYSPLGDATAFVAVFGQGFGELPQVDSVTRVDLDVDDPLVAEWNVVVISPNFAATLTARQLGAPSPGNDSYEFILTHDRRLTIEATRTLVARL